jgi:uncharacterized protein with PIN domain
MTDVERETTESNAVRPDEDGLFLDVMLGKLAVYLRMCGYDTAYAGDRDLEADDRLRSVAEGDDRILLTRDVELAERADRAVLLTERDIGGQLDELREVGVRLELAERPERCGRCNGRLDAVAADETTPEYAPNPPAVDCWRCRACGQVFWKGSHWERVRETLE